MKGVIYVGNHQGIKGIEDYLYCLVSIFENRNIGIKISSDSNIIDSDFIILIDNFINKPLNFQTNMLQKWKREGIVMILIHTEFIDKAGHFNVFSTRHKLYRKLLPSKLLLYLSRRRNSNSYIRLIESFFILGYLSLALILFINPREIRSRLYFAKRDQGLKQILKEFDIHATISEDVNYCLRQNMPELNPINLLPFINNDLTESSQALNPDQGLAFISGNITPYRSITVKKYIKSLKNTNWIGDEYRNLNNLIESSYINSKLNKDNPKLYPLLMSGFEVILKNDEYINYVIDIYRRFNLKIEEVEIKAPVLFEIYIGQTKKWPFISAMRIMRAIRSTPIRVPVNIGNYRESIFKKLCINVSSIDELRQNRNALYKDYIEKLPSIVKLFNIESNNRTSLLIDSILLKRGQ